MSRNGLRFVPVPTPFRLLIRRVAGADELFQNGPMKLKFVCLEAGGSRRSPSASLSTSA